VACVVITFHSEDVLDACLRACQRQLATLSGSEIIVVDNASRDRTVAVATKARAIGSIPVRLFANPDNRGFAAAVNQGFAASIADYVLVLNPDVELIDPIQALVEACGQYGLASGKLVGTDGRSQAGFTIRRFPTAAVLSLELLGVNRLWPSNKWNRRYRYLDRDLEQDGQVEQPAGAFLMIRRDVWQKVGGFDEGFWPVWFEDVDFCRRAADAGFRAGYVSTVRARHIGGHSIQKIDGSSRELHWYDSLLRYAAKHLPPGGYRTVCLAAVGSVVPRMVLNVLREQSLKPIPTGIRIFCFSGKRLVSAQHQLSRP
jgi:hypothetical protein